MFLTKEEAQFLDGEHGEALQLAMSILVKLGEMYGADRMIRVESVHIDASTYYGVYDAGLDFCEKLVQAGAIYRVPATLCIAAIDFERHAELGVPTEYVDKQLKLANAYLQMGAIPNWTCAPYQCGSNVRFGQNIAWGESNAIAFVNSVIGARTIRCADFVDVCAAITGLMPQFGLYLDEARWGDLVFNLSELDTSHFTSTDYAALGYYVGGVTGSRVPVLQGISKNISADQLKAFSAAVATSGSVGLFHMCGITPEARTLAEALGNQEPQETLTPGKEELAAIWDNLTTSEANAPNLAILGCPHYSAAELIDVARLLENKQVMEGKRLWVFTNRCAEQIVKQAGILEKIEAAGAKVICDTCFLHLPTDAWELFDSLATDSAKMSHYAPGIGNFKIVFTERTRCIEFVKK
jgi:predicted aconitase